MGKLNKIVTKIAQQTATNLSHGGAHLQETGKKLQRLLPTAAPVAAEEALKAERERNANEALKAEQEWKAQHDLNLKIEQERKAEEALKAERELQDQLERITKQLAGLQARRSLSTDSLPGGSVLVQSSNQATAAGTNAPASPAAQAPSKETLTHLHNNN